MKGLEQRSESAESPVQFLRSVSFGVHFYANRYLYISLTGLAPVEDGILGDAFRWYIVQIL